MKNTEENREKLARDIVESWDMDMLISYAYENLVQEFQHMSSDGFEEEWNNFYSPQDE